MDNLEKIVKRLAQEGIVGEIWVDGSFVTDKINPLDVDILVMVDGDFFDKASWGQLIVKKLSKDEMEFELISPLIVSRVKSKAEHFFQIEAGFLAQQIELQKQVIAETFEHPVKKANKGQFTVKWDRKDSI